MTSLASAGPLGRELRAAAEGRTLPPGFGAPRSVPTLENGIPGRRLAAAPQSSAPVTEYSVLFQYQGSRATLEAAGLRVVTQAGHYFTARVRAGEIPILGRVPGIHDASLARPVEPHLNLSLADIRADLEQNRSGSPPVFAGHSGKNILIGLVDSGIDFYNFDFLATAGKTRILYIWDQVDGGGPAPPAFLYGSEWTKSRIDSLPNSIRETDTQGHGTAVAGVLASLGASTGCSPVQPPYRYVGVAPEANLIVVKTDFTDAGVVDGVDYCFQQAAALGRPCVVNLSLGSQFGPHDGSGAFAQSLNALTGPGKIIVTSAGNERGTGKHGKLKTTSTTLGTDKFTLSVPGYAPSTGASNDYFLVNGWIDLTASATIHVKGPGAGDTLTSGLGVSLQHTVPGGTIYISNNDSGDGFGPTATAREFEVEVFDSISTSYPKPGTWEIDVRTNTGSPLGARADIWIYAASLGDSVKYPVVATGLNDSTEVGSPGDADSCIAVAAYATRNSWVSCSAGGGLCGYTSPPTIGAIASFSSIGPRRDGKMKPEISAPGFGVLTSHSSMSGAIPACGDADDGVHAIAQGTSFSSPHVAGAVALYLQVRPQASSSLMRNVLETHARADGFTGGLPNVSFGYGKLDVYGCFDHTPPACHVVSPNGGEALPVNSIQTVSWTASDSSGLDSVTVQYRLLASLPWITLQHGIVGTGSLSWHLPNSITQHARIRVTAYDKDQLVNADSSDTEFAITSVSDAGAAHPAVFALGRAQPNPSTGTTTFRFSLAESGPAELALYDTSGRKVALLATGRLSAGEHQVHWPGAGLPSGVYFYRLSAGPRVSVKKLVLAR